MAIEPGSIEHLTQIISQVIGPSFLLGAVAGFISMVHSRLNAVIDRIRFLNAIPPADSDRAFLKEDLPRQHRRCALLSRAATFGVLAGIVTTVLIITAFTIALFRFNHVYATAVLFIIALSVFCVALVYLCLDTLIAIRHYDHY